MAHNWKRSELLQTLFGPQISEPAEKERIKKLCERLTRASSKSSAATTVHALAFMMANAAIEIAMSDASKEIGANALEVADDLALAVRFYVEASCQIADARSDAARASEVGQ